MIEMDTRLRAARGIAKTETEAATLVFETLKARGHPTLPPPTVSDGWGGNREAMVEVYGQPPEYQGRGGGLLGAPTRKQPMPGWQYLQVVKQRDDNGNLIGIDLRVIFGDEDEVLALLGGSTAYIAPRGPPTHLTMRHFNSRLVRKSLAFSKDLDMHCAAAAWEDLVYNLARPLKSLRLPQTDHPQQRWRQRTPAMAAGLTNQIWSIRALLFAVPLPDS
jgi:hypothetical protein